MMDSKAQRDIAPDVLRGFALLGILVVNIQFMGLNSTLGARGEWVSGLANTTATFLVNALFAGKFYLLFSFLYGYSSAYIIRGDPVNRRRWIGRCVALMFMGAFHFVFLWHGDILFMYGVLGLLLVAFFFRSDKTLKRSAWIIFACAATLIALIAVLVLFAEGNVLAEADATLVESKLDEVLRTGTFLDSILPRVELWVFGLLSGIFLQGGLAFAAFLLGLRMARRRVLASPIERRENSTLIRLGLVLGLPVQLVAAWAMVLNEQNANPSEAIYLCCLAVGFVSAPLLSMAYVGIIRKFVEERPRLVMWMRPAGQVSLTVYIAQSAIASWIFGPWGLGMFQRLETWQVFLVAFGIWLLLIYLSSRWLMRFVQGPLEWLVSLLTRTGTSSGVNSRG